MLKSVTISAPVRPGTSRYAALECLIANIGKNRETVLAELEKAELAWQDKMGKRTVGISPPGWLRLFGTTFTG